MARILIVDGSAVQCAWLQQVLAPEGHTTVACRDLAQLRKRQDLQCDLSLVSLWLPGSNGFEVAPELQLRSGAPAVLLLPRRLEADVLWGRALGLRHFLNWPCPPARLRKTVQSLLAEGCTA